MGIKQLSAFGISPSQRAVFVNNNAGQQQQVNLTGGALTLPLKGAQYAFIPAGDWIVQAGSYSNVQVWDQQSYLWRYLTGFDQVPYMISSDGTNYRVINTTGAPIGACITNKGSATPANGFYGFNQAGSPVTIINGATTQAASAVLTATTPNSGTWNLFVGGAVSTSVTITTAGTAYTVAPTILVIPPASQGAQPFIPATVTCTISAGAINAVTVTNQGAGYVAAPTLMVVNAQGDLTGSGAVLTPILLASSQNTVTAITQANPGNAAQATVPSFTFSGTGSTGVAATVLMNLSIVSLAINAVGAAYGATQPTFTMAANTTALPTIVLTNPAIELGLIGPSVQPVIESFSAAGGTMTASTAKVLFGGYGFYSVPTASVYGLNSIQTTMATWTVTAGGNKDTLFLYPI